MTRKVFLVERRQVDRSDVDNQQWKIEHPWLYAKRIVWRNVSLGSVDWRAKLLLLLIFVAWLANTMAGR